MQLPNSVAESLRLCNDFCKCSWLAKQSVTRLEPVIFLEWSQWVAKLPNNVVLRQQVLPAEDYLGMIVAHQGGILPQISLINRVDMFRDVRFFYYLARVLRENELVGQIADEVELIGHFIELEVQIVHDLSLPEECWGCLEPLCLH